MVVTEDTVGAVVSELLLESSVVPELSVEVDSSRSTSSFYCNSLPFRLLSKQNICNSSVFNIFHR